MIINGDVINNLKNFNKFKRNSLACIVSLFPKELKMLQGIKYKKLLKIISTRNFSYESMDEFLMKFPVGSAVTCLEVVEINDEKLIISGHENGGVNFWKLSSNEDKKELKQVFNINAHTNTVRAMTTMTFMGQTLLITGGKDNYVKAWGFDETKKEKFNMNLHSDLVSALCTIKCENETLLVSGSWDNKIYVWSLSNRQEPKFKLTAHSDAISALIAFETDKERFLISGSWDDTINVWNLEGNDPEKPEYILTGHTDSISALTSIVLNKKNYLVSASWDFSVKVWDLSYRDWPIFNFTHSNSIYNLNTVNFNGEPGILCSGYEKEIYFWNFKNANYPKYKMIGVDNFFQAMTILKLNAEPLIVTGTKSHVQIA